MGCIVIQQMCVEHLLSHGLSSAETTLASKTDIVLALLELIRYGGHTCLEGTNSGLEFCGIGW